MTGVIGVSSQRRLCRKKEEFMWDELNRILGVNRKSELSSGEPRPAASAAREAEPGAKSENVADSPGETGHSADRGPSPAPADAGEDRALLGNLVAGVSGSGRVQRPGRRPRADRSLHRLVQLPAPA